jgi:hypothetical protein
VGGETRPTVIVHTGSHTPKNAYIAIDYEGQSYWVDRADFDSKYALNVVQNLMALAQSNTQNPAPIITVPAS